eukprot:CAMPEP_0176331252 /NCGR_PEP_ID=MMETSP0121_2-20121125/76457_1 /TAXON_ID=160619 /ORGANISM="Kryptoperidinium foliaceum, Strain CCMP 1326" /LENGTH=294 /DNA_ID=CAMNT_0017674097 /DNA_START=17 /DNA_END=902 /DNA_ORIENTATION=+
MSRAGAEALAASFENPATMSVVTDALSKSIANSIGGGLLPEDVFIQKVSVAADRRLQPDIVLPGRRRLQAGAGLEVDYTFRMDTEQAKANNINAASVVSRLTDNLSNQAGPLLQSAATALGVSEADVAVLSVANILEPVTYTASGADAIPVIPTNTATRSTTKTTTTANTTATTSTTPNTTLPAIIIPPMLDDEGRASGMASASIVFPLRGMRLLDMRVLVVLVAWFAAIRNLALHKSIKVEWPLQHREQGAQGEVAPEELPPAEAEFDDEVIHGPTFAEQEIDDCELHSEFSI